ncbi:MAG: methanogenesis marker 9 domain-containing protein [Methanothrix sp.]|nr:MAG: methanogenesis marker 9 domain-containing protein [Methanothrix sp.]
MLEVGYLHIDNPIAVISSYNQSASESKAGLRMLDGFDLDDISLNEMESRLDEMLKAGSSGAVGISATCSQDEPLLAAARIASQRLCLMELRLTKIRDAIRLLELIPHLKRTGVTLSVRIRPEDLSDTLLDKLNETEIDIIHLDLRGLNGAGPRVVKKARDKRGPAIMALADVGEFEDAKTLLSMGADVVSLRGVDPEFSDWLSGAMEEYESLSGWCNAPKHICAGGDLRGLAYCCPPVKHCAVLGALKKAGMTPEEFVEKKLRLAKGTPLEKGEGTCFGSLVWCCKISKMCYLRDAVLARMGLPAKEYMALKKKLAEDLLKTT